MRLFVGSVLILYGRSLDASFMGVSAETSCSSRGFRSKPLWRPLMVASSPIYGYSSLTQVGKQEASHFSTRLYTVLIGGCILRYLMDPSVRTPRREAEKSPKGKPGADSVKTTKKPWLVENVEHQQSEKPQVLRVSNSEWTDQSGDEFWPLSGKPYFSVVIAKSHLKPTYHLYLPNKMLPYLPPKVAPVVLAFRGKSWEMEYNGDRTNRAFDSKWRKFVNDNDVKLGDACIFELMESSPALKFRVQIIRGDFPAELLERDGKTSESAIVLE